MHTDRRGLALTVANADAAARYDETVEAYLAFSRETGNCLKQALAADPDMVMGHCTRGYFMKLFCNPPFEVRAKQAAAAAEAAMAKTGATPRERLHVAALKSWCDGDFEAAVARCEDILLDHPRDLLAHKLAHFIYFYLGDADRMRDSLARARYAWDESVPGYGYLLGMYAFALEESGAYGEAESTGRRAVEINPADIWAVHAVAHVMEMQGRHGEGIAWTTDGERHWQGCNNFAYHVWWHRALFLLEQRRFDAALALYDARIRADRSDEYLDIVNAAALLWRLEDDGVDVGGRWGELADKAERRKDDHLLAFIDAHFMMALAAGGRRDAAQAMLASMEAPRTGTEAPILAEVGRPLCAAVIAFRAGDYGRAADLLLPIRYTLRRIGGSHAQRDVFARMLIEAALRAGRLPLARALLAERTARKPSSPWSWRAYARALDGLGEAAQARACEDRARALAGAPA
jgi:tetratricopeptide (TPR) repeat protein